MSLGGRAVYLCNFPEGKSSKDAVELMATFGEINRSQVSREIDVMDLLPARRRRPTLPEWLRSAGRPTSGVTALVEFSSTQDALLAAANIDGAVYFDHEIVAGLTVKQ